MISITYRTTDGTRWGPGKGSNLTAVEGDLNLWNIVEAVQDLVDNPIQPNQLDNITLSGSELFFQMEGGAIFGPFPIPFASWHWLGNYATAVNYFKLDWFNVPGDGIFLVLEDHITPDPFDPLLEVDGNPAYMQISEAAAAGIAGLLDVDLDTLIDGQVLQWNATSGKWENVTLASVVGGAISTLTDVLLTGLTDGQFLKWVASSGKWVNVDAPSVPSVASGNILANLTGGAAVPVAQSVSAVLDYVFGNGQGSLLVRGPTTWSVLAPGTAGRFLKTQGAGALPVWDSPAGAGTVTSVDTADGITGGPITSAGTVRLAQIASGRVLANTGGGAAAPTGVTVSALLDLVLGSTRGSIAVRTGSGWAALAPGTAGYYLKTNGSGADAAWDSPAGSGTVTSVDSGTGLDGGPITGSGTLRLADTLDARVLANISGAPAPPSGVSITSVLDYVFGTTRGGILTRQSTAWSFLAPGTSGYVLTTHGSAADASWDAPGGGTSALVGVSLVVTGANGNAASLLETSDGSGGFFMQAVLDSFGSGAVDYTNVLLRRARGTSSVPTAVQSGDFLGEFTFAGHDGSGYSTNVTIQAQATENWSPGNHGARLLLSITPNGSGAGGAATEILTAGGATLGSSLADVTIASIADKDVLVYDSASGDWKNQRAKYIIGSGPSGGVLTASQILLIHPVTKAITIPANFGAYLGHASQAGGTANATASTVITVDKAVAASPNTFSNVGTITIGAGGVSPTFATSGGVAVNFAQGDRLRIAGPASADATFANFYSTLVAYET